MSRNTLIYTAIIFALLLGCKQTEEITKPRVTFKPDEGALLSYYLPGNSYHIQLKVIRKQAFRGPFVDYANDYLRIDKDIIKYNETTYEIDDVNINLLAHPDPAEHYYVLLDEAANVPITLNHNGILSGINTAPVKTPKFENKRDHTPEAGSFAFTDLSVSPIVDISEKISYEYKKVDSALVRVPVKRVETEVKNFQQLAWSAAKFISTIRENRFKLLAGISESDNIPEKVEFRVQEFNRLENTYLELFIGHQQTDTLTYNFTYRPEGNTPDDDLTILCFFSSSLGIQKPSIAAINTQNGKGAPISLKVTPTLLTEKRRKSDIEQIKNKGIIYRLPARASIAVTFRDKVITEKRLPIAQWGTHAYLPASHLNDSSRKIQFDENTGAILQIKAK
ncbi:MAG: DUF4831 family protein [Salinivirgaceae bacterium]|nr:DUF4831 family protein [Salinivirgaceae bacterium]